MIKIIHLARPVAGVGVYLKLLCKHLDSSNFKNEIILNNFDENIEILDGFEKKVKTYNTNLTREINFINDLKSLYQIIKILKTQKPDILHCHSAKSGILGRISGLFLGINTVYTPHAYSYLSAENKLKKIFLKNIERFFGFFPTKTITCSNSEYNRAINDLKINKEKVFLWNNSIENIFEINKSNYFKQLPEKYICSIGRPSFQKNTELLLKSIYFAKRKQENIHLVILGVGHYSPKLESIKSFIVDNNLTKNVTLIPWLKRGESLAVLEKSFFYISTSRYEGLPYSVIEALALEKVCVLTNVDGHKDLVKNAYNGYLVDEKANEIAKAVSNLYSNQDLISLMGRNSKKKFKDFFQINKNIKTLENLYLRL